MTTLYDFKVRAIDETELDLASLRGKVVLVVNVASQCGYTPQYKGLQAIYDEHRERGLVVLGVPANDFGAQEPWPNEEIKLFCEVRFKVSFPMLAKVSVKGPEKHPLYQWLTDAAQPQGEVRWNFEKFLIGRDGSVAARYGSKVEPESQELRSAITAVLG